MGFSTLKPNWPFRRRPIGPILPPTKINLPNPGTAPNAPNVVNFPGGSQSSFPPDPTNPFSYLINQNQPILSYGGVSASTTADAVPVVDLNGNAMFYNFDPTQGFNDLNADSTWFFRVEDFLPFRVPTARWVILTYVNLGPVTLNLNLTAVSDDQKVLAASKVCTIGNSQFLETVMTFRQGIELTGMNMQLSIVRKAGAGAISLSKVTLVGTVEESSY